MVTPLAHAGSEDPVGWCGPGQCPGPGDKSRWRYCSATWPFARNISWMCFINLVECLVFQAKMSAISMKLLFLQFFSTCCIFPHLLKPSCTMPTTNSGSIGATRSSCGTSKAPGAACLGFWYTDGARGLQGASTCGFVTQLAHSSTKITKLGFLVLVPQVNFQNPDKLLSSQTFAKCGKTKCSPTSSKPPGVCPLEDLSDPAVDWRTTASPRPSVRGGAVEGCWEPHPGARNSQRNVQFLLWENWSSFRKIGVFKKFGVASWSCWIHLHQSWWLLVSWFSGELWFVCFRPWPPWPRLLEALGEAPDRHQPLQMQSKLSATGRWDHFGTFMEDVSGFHLNMWDKLMVKSVKSAAEAHNFGVFPFKINNFAEITFVQSSTVRLGQFKVRDVAATRTLHQHPPGLRLGSLLPEPRAVRGGVSLPYLPD